MTRRIVAFLFLFSPLRYITQHLAVSFFRPFVLSSITCVRISMTCCLVLLVFRVYKDDLPVYRVSGDFFLSLCCMHLRFIRIVAGSYGSVIFHCSITLQRCGLFSPYFLFSPLHFTLASCFQTDQPYNDSFSKSVDYHPSKKGYAFRYFLFSHVDFFFSFKILATIGHHFKICLFSCLCMFISSL